MASMMLIDRSTNCIRVIRRRNRPTKAVATMISGIYNGLVTTGGV